MSSKEFNVSLAVSFIKEMVSLPEFLWEHYHLSFVHLNWVHQKINSCDSLNYIMKVVSYGSVLKCSVYGFNSY